MVFKYILKKIASNLGINSADSNLKELILINSESYILQLRGTSRYQNSKRLNIYEYKFFSQNGEDGIIFEIFKRIGITNKYFVEFGVGNGLENNTAYLFLNQWSGLWIEGDPKLVYNINKNFNELKKNSRLILKNAFVTKDNIEILFQESNVPHEFDLLSIDVDGNDYWIWKSIKNYSPRVIIIEYNATLGPDVEWVMEYNPTHIYDGTSYFGASLKSLEMLALEKGYRLVGCNLSGVNAFFVREDLVEDKFLLPFTSENHYEPPRYFLYKQSGHPRSYKTFKLS